MRMSKVVSDACLSAKWVLPEKFRLKARTLLNEWLSNGIQIYVPPLWENELDSILRERVWSAEMSQADADTAQAALDLVPVTVKHVSAVRQRSRAIAKQANQRRVYDSVYAALSENEGCELWTADYTFYKAVRGFLPLAKYLGNYKVP